jgi:membrane-bound serine protease (ClpP class)
MVLQQFLSLAGLNLSGLEGLIIILFVLGIALVVIEMVMPGIGAAGILGVVSLIAGVVLAAQVVSPLVLMLIIMIVLLIIVCMLFWLYKSATRDSRLSRLLLLKTKTGKEEGYNSVSATDELIGLEGISTTILRPAGIGDFQGRKLDVVTDGEFIPKGTPIKITHVEGFRIIVKKLEN